VEKKEKHNMSYLYIPDEDTDSIRYVDDPQDQDAHFFKGTCFNPSTGAFFRVAEIEGDMVRVSAIVTIPESQRDALLEEMQQEAEEAPVWADWLEEVDDRFVEEWDARLARYDMEHGYKRED
jgi:hypothetical protein